MSLNIDTQSIPRYLTAGMLGAVLLLLATTIVFFFSRLYDDTSRLEELHVDVVEAQKKRLTHELNSLHDYIRFTSTQAEMELEQQSKEVVDLAYHLAHSLYQQNQQRLTEAQLKTQIIEALRGPRFFSGRGYYFIDDMAGQCILLPTAPDLEGSSLLDNRDDTGHYIMRGLIDVVEQSETHSGYSRYRWYAPDYPDQMRNKIAYVRLFEPYGWIIGAGDYLYQFENDLKEVALTRIRSLRFGDNGYFSVLDREGNVLYAPKSSAQFPVHVDNIPSKMERDVVHKVLAVAEQGGGFVQYDWFTPNTDEPRIARKLSLVQNVDEWGWVLVAGVYPEEIEAVYRDLVLRQKENDRSDFIKLVIALSVIGAGVLVCAWLYGSWLKRLFYAYQKSIETQQSKIEGDAKALRIASRVFDTASEGIIVTNPDNQIVAVNRSFTAITGYQEEEVVGRSPSILSSGKHTREFYDSMWRVLQDEGRWAGEIWNRTKSGAVYPEQLSIAVSRDEDGNVVNYIATFSDVSDQKKAEEQLRYMADYDELTGLPNRRHLMAQVARLINEVDQSELHQFHLLFMDLDRFKVINDSLGHWVGDKVLQEIAQRLRQDVTDIDMIGRLGGDEFVILLRERPEITESAGTYAQRLIHIVAEAIKDKDFDLVITPSIGISSYPDDGADFGELVSSADAALYHAKSQGRNNYQFYRRDLNAKASRRLLMESALRMALERDELELYYQPQYNLLDRSIVGCEALLRWKHDGQFISPAEFIPLAEDSGLILSIGDWVLEEGCRQGAEWLKQGFDLPCVAINVSPVQFREGFFETVMDILERTGFPASHLELELTESTLMNDVNRAQQLLSSFRAIGVRTALDDFGTGYSSLAYLKKFSLDKLKIDRAFIDGLPDDSDDNAITASILDVARHLSLETIAEGVETEAQLNFLGAYGCDQVQGFYFSKPLTSQDFVRLLHKVH
ncbi:cache domain-containing protein [Neptunomonas sp. XY-337]|uniref:bifunctional diguanylate cyclase/phosphodiesterase n=1 Tax=Neptunomonas sp. XY-337 TaxID=2561897 RepID=UPI0010AACBD6|nr:cache domain-containing protein [Neptunomonas sp. XY-337]